MPARFELFDDRIVEARLDVERAGHEGVIVERTDEMERIEAWRFDRFLRVHAELRDVEKDLHERLILIVAARRGQDHKGLTVF